MTLVKILIPLSMLCHSSYFNQEPSKKRKPLLETMTKTILSKTKCKRSRTEKVKEKTNREK